MNPPAGVTYYPYFNAIEPPQGSGIRYAKVDPGHLVYLNALMSPLVSGTLYEPKKVVVLSMTGGKIEKDTLYESILVSPNVYQTSFINKLPYAYVNQVSGFLLPVRANPLNSKGHSQPIHVKARFEGNILSDYISHPENPTRTPVVAIYDFIVPVTESPSLEVTADFSSLHPGELRPDGSATVNYHATAAGSPMKNLSFRARIPSGTTLIPGQIFPAGGVQTGNQVLWRLPGPITRFDASLAVRVKKRPGVKTSLAKYNGAAQVLDFTRSAPGRLKMPIKGYAKGNLEYYTDGGIGGSVTVGETYQFACLDWDAEGGDIFVSLNDVGVTSVPLSLPVGPFTVPPFRDPDLQHILSARQKGPTTDTVVTGATAAEVEMSEGVVKITDGSSVFRRLEDGSLIAKGEVPVSPDVSTGSNRFGLLQIDGPAGAALVRFQGNTRLLFARGGDIAIYGGIQVGKLRLHTGKKFATVPFDSHGEDFSGYDTAGAPDLTTLTLSESTSTVPSPLALVGNCRSGPLHHTGPIQLNGAILYIDGDATIIGDITGQGALICTGNLTHKGSFHFTSNNQLALGVSGTFTTAP